MYRSAAEFDRLVTGGGGGALLNFHGQPRCGFMVGGVRKTLAARWRRRTALPQTPEWNVIYIFFTDR